MYWRNKARQALSSFLLRQGYRYGGRSAWTVAYWRWLATIRLEHPAQQITMQEYIIAIQEADARHDRLAKQIEAAVPDWSLAPRKGTAGNARRCSDHCGHHRCGDR